MADDKAYIEGRLVMDTKQELVDDNQRLRAALEAIKVLCAGDAAPHWRPGVETTKSRVAICDMVDVALGNAS